MEDQIVKLSNLLKEAESLLGQHHLSSLCTWQGNCPVCRPEGVNHSNDIFARIQAALKIHPNFYRHQIANLFRRDWDYSEKLTVGEVIQIIESGKTDRDKTEEFVENPHLAPEVFE